MKTNDSLKLASPAFWLALLLPVLGFAEEQMLLEKPTRVITSTSAAIFPKSWLKPPVLASGEVLPVAEHERVRRILTRALGKYPPQVLRANLKAVYVLAELRYSGVITSGTNSLTSVYLKIGHPKAGFTDAHIEGVFHAEFSSILIRQHAAFWDKETWQAVNPPDFRYLGNGVDAVKQRLAGLTLSESLHAEGFLKQYSKSTLENDLNGIAAMLLTGKAELWDIAKRFPRIRRKLELTLAFYQKLDPAFAEAFFRSLVRQ